MGKPINVRYVDDYVIFNLTNSRSPEKEKLDCYMDRDDYIKLVEGESKWIIANRCGINYLQFTRKKLRRSYLLHRLIMNQERVPGARVMGDRLVVDHKNRNGLDNRRANLHLLKASDNTRRAVRPSREGKCFYREIRINKDVKKGKEYYRAFSGAIYVASAKSMEMLKNKIDIFWNS